MAGQNKILKPGQVLFAEGDQSNGMYVVRKGEILIYLDKAGTEIPLAKVGAGAMIGEMALFDKKPRSASARAVDDVEVTVISNDDFTKILKQIPKWFVTLMATLSARLRDTNAKLQDLEANYKGNMNPLEELVRVLHILHLLFYKLGEKEVKSWLMEKDLAEKEISLILNLAANKIQSITSALVKGGLISIAKNRYKKEVFSVANRGNIEKFIEFVGNLRASDPNMKEMPAEVVDMIDMMNRIAEKSAYETLSINYADLESEAEELGMRTGNWNNCLTVFKQLDGAIEMVKSGEGIAFKVNKKGVPKVLANSRLLLAITKDDKKSKGKKAA